MLPYIEERLRTLNNQRMDAQRRLEQANADLNVVNGAIAELNYMKHVLMKGEVNKDVNAEGNSK
jgi:hypothetical protein